LSLVNSESVSGSFIRWFAKLSAPNPLQAQYSNNLLEESNMMMKRWYLSASVVVAAILVIMAPVVSAESFHAFRQKSGLQAYVPPEWLLKGYFFASEKNPRYIFGPVQKFIEALGGTTTWLIEDMELERLKEASANGQKIEYSLFLEAASPDHTEYWVFVALPFENAQAWYDAKRAYHGRKAVEYYGTTRNELERAQNQGLNINAELRFWIENGETRLQAPENVIMSKYKFQPVFDLGKGRRLDPAAKTE
jgi:hypothetical protein